MKILSFLNVSNFEDINSDSGYIFNSLLSNEFIREGNEFGIILPIGLKNLDKFKGCQIYHANIGITKYESRFNFVWKDILKIILDFNPQVIFLNQCELTAALKALLVTNNLNNIKVATYCHYPTIHVGQRNKAIIDYTLNNNNIGEAISFSVLAAVNIADVFIIQSEFARNLIKDYAKAHNFLLRKKIHIVPPPYDPFLYKKLEKKEKNSNIVIYNHRLYKSYGTDKLFEIIKNNPANIFYVLNPMSNRSQQRKNLNDSPSENIEKLNKISNVKIIDGSDRNAYKSALSQGKVAIACHRKACVWSMSAIDCLSLNVPVIAPDFAVYKEIIPKFLRFKTIKESKILINKLLIDKNFNLYAVKQSRLILKKLSPSVISKKILKLLLGV